jgi:uncharacterized membrane protein
MEASMITRRSRAKDSDVLRDDVDGTSMKLRDRFASKSRIDLTKPRARGLRFGIHYDNEAFGRFSETIARFIGTARFLVFQTVFVIIWLLINSKLAPEGWRFDGDKLQLLTLILSLQAAYAAPLILLAQNRQADRDRISTEHDRGTASRTQSDTEYLARELAAIRIGLADVATTDEIEKAVTRSLEKILERTSQQQHSTTKEN